MSTRTHKVIRSSESLAIKKNRTACKAVRSGEVGVPGFAPGTWGLRNPLCLLSYTPLLDSCFAANKARHSARSLAGAGRMHPNQVLERLRNSGRVATKRIAHPHPHITTSHPEL